MKVRWIAKRVTRAAVGSRATLEGSKKIKRYWMKKPIMQKGSGPNSVMLNEDIASGCLMGGER